jgi:hypothetical protein
MSTVDVTSSGSARCLCPGSTGSHRADPAGSREPLRVRDRLDEKPKQDLLEFCGGLWVDTFGDGDFDRTVWWWGWHDCHLPA